MEVLETVDRERLAELHERDEFFWLDLTEPTADDLKTVGELLGLHPVALEDTIEFGQRPKLDQLRRPRPRRLLHGAPRARVADDAGRAGRDPHLHLGLVRGDRPPLDLHGARRAPPRARHGGSEGRALHRLPHLRRPHRRLLSHHRGPRGASRRDRGGGAAGQAPEGAAGRDLPPQAERAGALPARRAPARPLPRRHGHDPQPAGPLARHARVPARRRRPPGADRRRAASSAGGPPGAHRDLLQRQRESAQQRRHAADDRRHVLPRLDARDRLLRPELRLADRQHRHQARLPGLRRRGARRPHR